MSSEEVFQLVKDVVPVELLLALLVDTADLFFFFFRRALLLVQVAEQSVGEVAQAALVQRLSVLVDDVLEDEPADFGAPRRQLLHVAAVGGQEPRQEIDSVALVDVPEDLVEEADNFGEGRVVVVEPGTAHVVREDVGAHGQQRRFQIDALLAGQFSGRRLQRHLLDHQAALGSQDAAQSVELEGRSARMAIVTGQRATGLLQVGPIAKRQS